MHEAADQHWSTRALDRHTTTLYYLLKCFVLFDLKTGELTHQDIGQMDWRSGFTARSTETKRAHRL